MFSCSNASCWLTDKKSSGHVLTLAPAGPTAVTMALPLVRWAQSLVTTGAVLDFTGVVLDVHGAVLDFTGVVLDVHGAVHDVHGTVLADFRAADFGHNCSVRMYQCDGRLEHGTE